MADLGNSERDIDQAIFALKKGTQLIKYSRKGKPKFRSFRLSPDETTLIWLSHGEKKTLKLSSVTRIVPGQRTAVFKRYLRPEKEYLSFSLLYNNGERSLDLICKDKNEAELWLAGLKALIGQNRHRRSGSDTSDLQDGSSVRSSRQSGSSIEFAGSIASSKASIDFGGSDVGSERGNMQFRSNGGDGFRVSVSSAPSVSSGGSAGQDDIESLGDVYVWGEVWSDGLNPDGSVSSVPAKIDVLTPKPLESNLVLDVLQISCGARHVALVTKQGEVFTWGDESGGRLGHGVEKDFSHPRLVESLALTNVDSIASGEYHTCVVSNAGDLFTWGDGTHNAGILGHGTDVSHWIPKRVTGAIESLQVLSIACGVWHSALATSNGKLFTFGDGTFGALGHGDRESVTYPKQVQMLSALKTTKVTCGVWHTAAIVEVTSQSGGNTSSKKLFTWGDGDKHRLGHGTKETYLVPTCVSSLIDYNFHQIGCGHTITVALTTSGHVFTMGGTAHGQLGNPGSDGKLPSLVKDKLVGEFVEEISCGAHHVAVLTSRSEVFTWGKGANGRLGHGDIEDRKSPTLVETLKDKHVKNISCGSNFTSSICIHKWLTGTDQSVCSGCHQAFGFTRKRHNCYNCGLVHCHNCSSKKALKAALAPTPGKPHRVCDACYTKLKAAESCNASNANRKVVAARSSVDGRERLDRYEARPSRLLLYPTTEPVKYFEMRSGKHGTRSDSPSLIRASQVPSLLQMKDIAFPSSLTAIQNVFKPIAPSPSPPPSPPAPQAPPAHASALSPINSRSSSPYSRRPSPPRSSTAPFSKNVIDRIRKSNGLLNQEVAKLQNQNKSLKQKNDSQDMEIMKLQKSAQQATKHAEIESSKSKEAMKLLKSIKDRLMKISEKLPPDASDGETFKDIQNRTETFLKIYETSGASSSSLPENLESSPMEGTNDVAAIESSKDKLMSTKGITISGGGEKELTEQFEHGVYITYVNHSNGGKIFRRVRFSKKKFVEQQAGEWWTKNKDRVFKKYAQNSTKSSTVVSSSTPPPPQSASDETASSSQT